MAEESKMDDDFMKLIEKLPKSPSYSARKIISWLNENNFLDHTLKACSLDFSLTRTGVQLKLNDIYELSIQTHPSAAGDSFAETALMYSNSTDKKGIVYIAKIGYYDVIRHSEPSDLFEHLMKLKEIFNRDGELFSDEEKRESNGFGSNLGRDDSNASNDDEVSDEMVSESKGEFDEDFV